MHYIRTPFQNVWVCLCDRQGVFKETWLNCNSKKDKVKGETSFILYPVKGTLAQFGANRFLLQIVTPIFLRILRTVQKL